jgi:uncharacterized membrane protein YhaH (DUF805 family)
VDWRYLLWSFSGRIPRRTFWIAFVVVAAAELIAHLIANQIEGERLSSIVSLAFGYPEFAILAKRGQDRNISAWVPGAFYAFSAFIDFLFVIGAAGTGDEPNGTIVLLTIPWIVCALALLLDFGCRRGTIGPNRFGPDPLGQLHIVRRGNGQSKD